jgi:hypothetical protein
MNDKITKNSFLSAIFCSRHNHNTLQILIYPCRSLSPLVQKNVANTSKYSCNLIDKITSSTTNKEKFFYHGWMIYIHLLWNPRVPRVLIWLYEVTKRSTMFTVYVMPCRSHTSIWRNTLISVTVWYSVNRSNKANQWVYIRPLHSTKIEGGQPKILVRLG